MSWYRRGVPPLELLVAFEAAARLSSFTAAAAELAVTQSAVSQRIRALEAHLGAKLFDRGHRAVRLTAAGRDFQNGVAAALKHLLAASVAVRRSEDAPRLRIAADQSVAEIWLAPRLPAFRAAHPGLTIDLFVSDRVEECLGARADAAILHGDGSWAGQDCALLFDDEIFPVCAPEVAAGVPDLEALLGAALLDLDYEQWDWMNWSVWLTEVGAPVEKPPIAVRSTSYPLLIDAARRGLGVALGWRCMVADDLSAGRLVRPVDAAVRTGLGYFLLTPHNVPATPGLAAFRAWLQSVLGGPDHR